MLKKGRKEAQASVQVINIRGKKWSVGIEWEALSDGTMSEAKEFAKKNHASFGIFADYGDNRVVGLTKNKIKVDSAAYNLMIANQENLRENPNEKATPDWIVIEDVGDDLFWIGVIKEGVPAPEYDKVFDITALKTKFHDLIKSDTYVVFTKCKEFIDFFDGLREVRELGLNELTEDVSEKPKSVKLKGIPDKYIYLIIATVSLFGAAWGLTTVIEGKNLKEKARLLNERRLAQERMIEREYQEAMVKYEETLKALNKATQDSVLYGLAGNPKVIISAWFNELANYRLGTHGWKLLDIECYYNPVLPDVSALTGKLPEVHNGIVLGCDYLYTRTGFATNRMLLQEYSNAKISGNMALVTKRIDLDPKYLKPAPESSLKSLPSSKNWGFDMISQLQLLKMAGIDHTVGHSVDITYTAPSKPLTPKQKKDGDKPTRGGVVSTGFAKGDLRLKSKNLELLQEVADSIDFIAVGVKSVKLKVNSLAIVSWDLLANYYVNSKEGGVVGADSASVQSITPNASPDGQVVGAEQNSNRNGQ